MGQLETEIMIASQLMRDPDLLYSFPIKKENIRNPEVREIIEALKDIQAEGLKYSRVEIYRKLPHIPKKRLREIAETTVYNANFFDHIEEIQEFIRLDKVEEIESIVSHSRLEGLSSMEIIAKIEAYISSIDDDDSVIDVIGFVDVIGSAITDLSERAKNPGLRGESTGYKRLDDLFGGFVPSRLYYISARPSGGKTALMLNMFLHQMANNVSSGIISIESTISELGGRLLSIGGGLYADDVSTGDVSEKDINDLRENVKKFCNKFGPFYHNPHTSIEDIEVQASRMKAKHDIKIMFIDYTQLISTDPRLKRHEQVANVSRRLKAAALKNNIAIVALSQLKRDVDGRKAGLGDNAESSSFEKDADVMMAIDSWTNDSGYEETAITVLKARDGSKGECKVIFQGPKLIFKELI